MKTKALFILLFIASLSLSAQIEKGTFMVEGGINLTDNWTHASSNFIEGFGISFGTHDEIGKDYVTGKEKVTYTSKDFGFSVSPRLGYSLFRNFVVGTDFKYIRNIHRYAPYDPDDKSVDRATIYGFFGRKYFAIKNLSRSLKVDLVLVIKTFRDCLITRRWTISI